MGRLAELAAQCLAVENAAVNLGIADVKTEEHGRWGGLSGEQLLEGDGQFAAVATAPREAAIAP